MKTKVTTEPGRPLADGLYSTGYGRGTEWFYVKEGVMYLSTSLVSPLLWMSSGKDVMLVDKRTFLRARDLIDIIPDYREDIEKLAASRGVSV